MPYRSRISAASRFIRALSIRPSELRSSRPRKTFWATLRSGIRLISWYMVLIPAACDSRGSAKETSSPLKRTWPSSGLYTPVITLIKVDFPAPFSPTRACTSPGCSSKETSSRASTLGNRFVTRRTSRIGECRSIVLVPPLVGLVQTLLSVLLGIHVILDDDLLRYRLPGQELLDGVESQRTEARVGLDHGVDVTRDYRLHGLTGTVDGDYLHVLPGILTGVFEGLDGPERHLVVLRIDRVYVGVGLNELFHDRLALGPEEFPGLGGNYLHVRVLLELLLEALGTVDRDRGTGCSLEHGNLALLIGEVGQEVGGLLSLLVEVRAHEGYVVLARRSRRLAVDQEDRHPGLIRGVERRVHALLKERCDDNGVHVLGDHVPYVGDLLCGLRVGVGIHELLDVPLLRLAPYGLRLRDAERVDLLLRLREPDDGILEFEVRRLDLAHVSAGLRYVLLGLLSSAPSTLTFRLRAGRRACYDQHQAYDRGRYQARYPRQSHRFTLSSSSVYSFAASQLTLRRIAVLQVCLSCPLSSRQIGLWPSSATHRYSRRAGRQSTLAGLRI